MMLIYTVNSIIHITNSVKMCQIRPLAGLSTICPHSGRKSRQNVDSLAIACISVSEQRCVALWPRHESFHINHFISIMCEFIDLAGHEFAISNSLPCVDTIVSGEQIGYGY